MMARFYLGIIIYGWVIIPAISHAIAAITTAGNIIN